MGVDYKSTVFLPDADFPMRAGLPEREPETLKRSPGKADVKLIVVETLKGVAPGGIFDVRVNGLLVVGGYYKDGGRTVQLRGRRQDYPKT